MEAYCRLCAVNTHIDKLIDLKTDKERQAIVVEQLARVNVTMDFDFEIFPNTTCIVCLEELERTSRFVKDIEQAQIKLCSTFLVKEEKSETVADASTDHIFDHQNDKWKADDKDIAMAELSNFTDTSLSSPSEEHMETGVNKMPIENAVRKVKKSNDITVQALARQPPLSSWAEYRWDCAFCEAQFSKIEEIKIHSLENHICCNAYRCTDCGQRGFSEDLFLKHISGHHTALQNRCHRCEKDFTSSRNLYLHDCTMTTDKDKQYLCPGCSIRFDTIPELEAHINKYFIKPNPSKNGSYLCNICQKYFKSKAIVNAHKKTHEKKYKELICDQCGKKFPTKSKIRYHVMLHLENRPYSCDICKRSFKLEILLKKHVKNLHSTEDQFCCEVCGKKFKCKLYLTKHKKIHEAIKKFACNYCDKKFLRKPGLEMHMRQHTGDRPYCCQYCGKTFVNSANYYKHRKRKHQIKTLGVKELPKDTVVLSTQHN